VAPLDNKHILFYEAFFEQIISDNEKAAKLGRLLGIIHGDGNASYRRILITDKCEEFHKILHRLFIEIFNVAPSFFRDKNRNTFYTHTKNRMIYWVFTEKLLVNKGSVRKKIVIPPFILENNIQVKREYVGGLFDAEASVKRRQAEIMFVTTTKILWEFIQNILNASEIKFSTNIRTRRKNPEYEIYIYGKNNLEKFQEQITFLHPMKREILTSHLERSHTH
jgi:intein/homing endonuclease